MEIEYAPLEALESLAELQYIQTKHHYRHMPVDMEAFICDSEYLDLGDVVYQEVKKMAVEITEEHYNEVVVMAGIGAGKSFLSQILALYAAHVLLCLKDPHGFFNLANDKPITIINMGISETQAKRVVFGGIKSLANKSPWFQRFRTKKMALSLTFDSNIELVCGNSQETTPLGMNLFCAILDEAAFYLDTENKNAAEEIYHQLSARIASRFGKAGMLIVISSPRHEKDFINAKLKESKVFDRMYGKRLPTWKAKDRYLLDTECFVFDREAFTVVPLERQAEFMVGDKKYDLTLIGERAVNMEYGDDRDKRFWIIPKDYEDTFRRNPERATRDLGAYAHGFIDSFFKIPEQINKCVGKHKNPVDDNGNWKLPKAPEDDVFIHIDLALNREGKGDAAGIAIGHWVGYEQKYGGMAKIKIDLVERITSGGNREIKFSDIRSRIAHLENEGWEIMYVTMDGWQSIDTQQILEDWGISTEELSVDRDTKPYESLKESVYANLVEFPAGDNDHVKTLLREMAELEVIKGKKIDHPDKGSKDVSDAVAGVVAKIKEHYGVEAETPVNIIRAG